MSSRNTIRRIPTNNLEKGGYYELIRVGLLGSMESVWTVVHVLHSCNVELQWCKVAYPSIRHRKVLEVVICQ